MTRVLAICPFVVLLACGPKIVPEAAPTAPKTSPEPQAVDACAPTKNADAPASAFSKTDSYAEYGPVYVVRDSGKRCITAPCPSWIAVDSDGRTECEITGVDLSALNLTPERAALVRTLILSHGLWAQGRIKTVPKQGLAGDGVVLFVNVVCGNALTEPL